MRTLQEKYNGIQEGKFSKDQFIVEARMQHPNLITRFNGYADAVSILKNRGMIQEAEESFADIWKHTLETDNLDKLKSFLKVKGKEGLAQVKAKLVSLHGQAREKVAKAAGIELNEDQWDYGTQVGTGKEDREEDTFEKIVARSDSFEDFEKEIQNQPSGRTNDIEGLRRVYNKYKGIKLDESPNQGALEVGDVFRNVNSEVMLKDNHNYEITSVGDYIIKFRDQENPEWAATVTLDKFKELVGKGDLIIFPKKDTSFSKELEEWSPYGSPAFSGEKEKEKETAPLSSLEVGDVVYVQGVSGDNIVVKDKREDGTVGVGHPHNNKVYYQDGNKEVQVVRRSNIKEARLTKNSLTDYRFKPTNDMDKYPYEQILRGLRVELETLGVHGTPTPEEYSKALSKVSKNLAKDAIFYTNQLAGVNPKVDLHDKMVDATAKNTVDTFNGMKKATLKEGLKNLIKQALQEEEEVYELYAEDEDEIDYDDENFSDPMIDGDLDETADTEADKNMVRKLMAMYETEPSKFERVHKQAQVQADTAKDIKAKHLASLFDRAKAGALQSLANQDRFEADREGMGENADKFYAPTYIVQKYGAAKAKEIEANIEDEGANTWDLFTSLETPKEVDNFIGGFTMDESVSLKDLL